MTSKMDSDAQLSSTKIDPLASETKKHVTHSDHGVMGEDYDVEHTHIEPLDSPVKEHDHHPWHHGNTSQGVIGKEKYIQDSKLAPLGDKMMK